jgi:hypothetical protein
MKQLIILVSISVVLLLSGCRTRSISNSGYGNYNYYPGELSELEVLGVNPEKEISEQDIQEALHKKKEISITRGEKIVLIQSGAHFPDATMTRLAENYFEIIPLSGVPANPIRKNPWQPGEDVKAQDRDAPLDMSLRLAAARAGAKGIIVYWGVLESGRTGYATKTISWVPIAGYFIPDETQLMRIRIKAAIIDVESGDWEMLIPEVFEDDKVSAIVNREQADQAQVEDLKEKAYSQLIEDMKNRYDL